MFYIILILWLLLDQWTKYYIMNHFMLGESLVVIPNVFHLTYIINRGAAFGMLANQRWFFLLVAVILLVGTTAISSFGLTGLIAKGYGTLAWVMFIVYVIPILTLGIYKISKAKKN